MTAFGQAIFVGMPFTQCYVSGQDESTGFPARNGPNIKIAVLCSHPEIDAALKKKKNLCRKGKLTSIHPAEGLVSSGETERALTEDFCLGVFFTSRGKLLVTRQPKSTAHLFPLLEQEDCVWLS